MYSSLPRHRTIILSCAFIALHALVARVEGADDVTVKNVNGSFSHDDLSVECSGSGLIIGPRLILTNRHVVQDESSDLYTAFRIRLGPDYKKKMAALIRHLSTPP